MGGRRRAHQHRAARRIVRRGAEAEHERAGEAERGNRLRQQDQAEAHRRQADLQGPDRAVVVEHRAAAGQAPANADRDGGGDVADALRRQVPALRQDRAKEWNSCGSEGADDLHEERRAQGAPPQRQLQRDPLPASSPRAPASGPPFAVHDFGLYWSSVNLPLRSRARHALPDLQDLHAIASAWLSAMARQDHCARARKARALQICD